MKPKRSALSNLYNMCVAWHAQIGTDGSLRDPTGARSSVEIRTSPASGDFLVTQLSDIMRAIRKANGIVNNSCGLHVHVNVADASSISGSNDTSKLDTFIRVWQYVQRDMYALVLPYRRGGGGCDYAKPWNDSAHYLTLHHARGNTGRYSGLNLESISKYNTVEFRLHHGSLNTRMVTAWAMLCGALVDVCIKGYEHKALLDYAQQEPKAFLWSLAMNNNMRAYLTYGATRWESKHYQAVMRRAA